MFATDTFESDAGGTSVMASGAGGGLDAGTLVMARGDTASGKSESESESEGGAGCVRVRVRVLSLCFTQ
jgi:hypothetical protein